MMDSLQDIPVEDLPSLRSFLLMLSPESSNEFTKLMGLLPVSVDGAEAEDRDIQAKWMYLLGSGALPLIVKASKWMSLFLSLNSTDAPNEHSLQQAQAIFNSFGAGMVAYLVSEGVLDFPFPTAQTVVSNMLLFSALSDNNEDFLEDDSDEQ